jgi:hypothetical protein
LTLLALLGPPPSIMAWQRDAGQVVDLSADDSPSAPVSGGAGVGGSSSSEQEVPAVIRAAVAGCGQHGLLVADLYARLLRADPGSATAAVRAQETRGGELRRRNAHIAGSWELFCLEGDGSIKSGHSVTFGRDATLTSDLYVTTDNPESGSYELFASGPNVTPMFDSLNVASLTFQTKSKIMRRWIKGELTITIMDADTFHGVLATRDDNGPDGYGRDPERFYAEFTGRRHHVSSGGVELPPAKKRKGKAGRKK